MGASITLAGENLIAQKQAANAGLKVSRFIFANVPGLDTSGPVNRAAGKPAAAQIVHSYPIPDENAGYVNPNQIVYSAQIGSDIGDWDFNWIGLETAEDVLFAVAYVPVQQKRRNIPPLQIGNNLTRNFLVVFDGAQALTGITIDANTWQHDFTVRLAGIDERERQSNRDVFGRACFFGGSLLVEKVGSAYQVKPGTAYVEGIRLERTAVLPIVPPAFPTTAWLDVALQRELSDVVANWQVVFAADRPDYTDGAGVKHYCVAIADLPNANTITDRRPVEAIGGPLVQHFAARMGDYVNLRARATTKDDVKLGNLPNAKSDDPASNNSEILATTKAVMAVLSRAVQNATDGTVDTDTDWNTITTAGLFPKLVGANNANGPETAVNSYRYPLVIRHSSSALTQLALPYSTGAEGEFEWRTKYGSSWTPWRRLRHSGSSEVHSFTASVTLNTAQMGTVMLDATAGNLVCTLPASNVALGVVDLIVRREDNSANRITVLAAGADKLKFHTHLNPSGYGFLYLMGAGDWWHLRADGAGGWLPIGRLDPTALGRPVFETTTAFQPGGWGAFNGPLIIRAEWPWLWDHAQQSGMLTTEANRTGMEGGWTSGDGAATFRGPEGRGEFVRMLDEARGVDRFDVRGTLTSGSNTVSAVTFGGNRAGVGMGITGTGIPVGTTITAAGVNTLTLSANATASGVGLTLTIAGRVAGSSAPDAIAKHRHPQYEYDTGNSVAIPDGSLAYDLNAAYTIGYDRTSLIGYFGGPETKPRSLAYPGRMKLL